jgi:SH3-like domain-containing protein
MQAESSAIYFFSGQFGLGSFRRCFLRFAWAAGVSLCVLGMMCGCSRLRPKPKAQYVYVTAKQTYLRDRVAAVSNRTATVENGDKLKVLERGRRFMRVETDKGETGWIDEKVVATQEIFDQFEKLAEEHKSDPAVASGVVRDDVYLHVLPGRESERFYRLAESEKLKLLKRATLLKPVPPGMRAMPAVVAAAKGGKAGAAVEAPAPPAMEDWWLVRDSRGETGWMLSRMMDVDAPDSLVRYSEGQRMVGAYVLTTVHDPEAPGDNKDIPEYVTALGPYKAGLTYDFDQVRVFIWNAKKHRYETAYRDRNIEGYLPIEVKMAADPYGKAVTASTPAPTYSYRVLSDEAGPVVPDPVNGAIVPGKTVLKTYRLEGNLVRRIMAPGTTAPGEARPAPEEKKAPKGKRRR